MWQTRAQLRIIIRQEYRQKHRNGKGTSHADNQELAEVFTSIHSLYPIPGICHEYKSGQGFYGLRYGWLLYCLGFLFLHKLHHCCISLFRQLDIAIKSFCIFIAVGCDGVIHIGKLSEGCNDFVYVLLIIIKARLQSHIYGLRYQHFQFIIQFLGTRKNNMLLVTTCNYWIGFYVLKRLDGQEFSFVCSQQQSLPFSRLGQFYFQAHSLSKNWP